MQNVSTKREVDVALLEESIEHWELMRDNRHCGRRPGIADCPLCREYYIHTCYGCPIFEHTEKLWCGGSPYKSAARAHTKGSDEGWREAANEMIEFLKGLRDGLTGLGAGETVRATTA